MLSDVAGDVTVRRTIFRLLIRPTLGFGRVQAWIGRRRIAAVGSRRWVWWLAAWLPVRLVSVVLYRACVAVAP